MPAKVDDYIIANPELDKRRKLSESDKLLIGLLYALDGKSQRELAIMFNVSRRLVQFIVDPEKQKENYRRRLERGGSKQYYDSGNHKLAMQRHRQYKTELLSENKLTLKG